MIETGGRPMPDFQDSIDLLQDSYRFVAVDVETANRQQGSICQIGLALVSADNRIETIGLLIDPEQSFESFNVRLHGIDQEAVAGAATFEMALQVLRPFLERHILVQHSSFDKHAFDAACNFNGIPSLGTTWLDSVRIARRAWPELKGNGGHGLASLKGHLNLTFNHHDAEEDARAAAMVTLLAEERTGEDFVELAGAKQKSKRPAIAVDVNQDGPLYGQVACFTGQLAMSRLHAVTIAAGAGVAIKTSVSKTVTLLVVGEQDMITDAEHDKSSKHRRAEQLADGGHHIQIVGERTFLKMIGG